jgi:hypothetical protein
LDLKPQILTTGGGRRGRGDTISAEARQQQRLDRLEKKSSDDLIDRLLHYAMRENNENDTTDVGQKFMEEFSIDGNLIFDTFRLRTPDFPLPILILHTDVGITSRTFSLKNAKFHLGNTDMLVSGQLDNFKRFMFNDGTLRGNINLKSHIFDANQLMAAMNNEIVDTAARRGRPRAEGDTTQRERSRERESARTQEVVASADVSDDKMFEVNLEVPEEMPLFMIPRTLNLSMNVDIDTLFFKKNTLRSLHGEAEVRDEFLRLNQFRLFNGGGQMDIVMAYKARSLQEAHVWVDVEIDKTEIQELLKLYPEIQDEMPITKSLEGLVDISLTASAMLDSAMNVDLSRTKASCNLHGKNLVLLDGETFTEIAKMLRFKNKGRNLIDSLSVDLVVNNNKIEIFPFKLTMDRYILAVGGTQDLDMNYDYHITVLRSPIPFTMGINISGTPEKMNFPRLVSPKYKDLDSPATSVHVSRTINVQREFKRLLDYEFEQIVGRMEN